MVSEQISLYDSKKRRKYTTTNELDAILEAAHDVAAHQRSLCLVLAHTGCLITEAINLCASDIDIAGEAIFFGKREGHERAVPVSSDVIEALNIIHGIQRAQAQTNMERSVRLWPVDRTTAWRWIRKISKKAEIYGPQAGPRGLRYGFMVENLQKGTPVKTVQQWMGNKASISEKIYAEAMKEKQN